MAALRDIARDFAAEIRDGIGWTIVYRTGRSWNALTIWSDIWNGEWETDDLNDAIGILKADPDAVIVNGYYCGHFGEDMTIDEIAAGIRWHYEGGRNRLKEKDSTAPAPPPEGFDVVDQLSELLAERKKLHIIDEENLRYNCDIIALEYAIGALRR